MALSNFCGSSNSFRYKDKVLCIGMQVLFFFYPQIFYICGMSTKVPIQINCISCGKKKETCRHGTKYCSNKCKSRYRRKMERITPPIPRTPPEFLEMVIYYSLSQGNAFIRYETLTLAEINEREWKNANVRYWTEEEFSTAFKKFEDICGCVKCLNIWKKMGYRRYKKNCLSNSFHHPSRI